jgi:parvulin-like peptidyl-prolyl cis-trans isomerase-like protein
VRGRAGTHAGMKRILREPLLHFLVLGAALFGVNALLSARAPGRASIVVTRGRIESMAAAFALTWQRPPTARELDGLIRDYVREEAAVREAVALGLDQDDVVIRRRLRQKLEFVSEDAAAQAEPTDAELRAWLAAHPGDFGLDPTSTFSQVFLDPSRHSDLATDAARLLVHLRRSGASPDITTLGDPFLLGHWFDKLPAREVKSQFGEKFAASMDSLAPGQWQGPIESGYGAHLVFVHARSAGHVPPLAEVRDPVRRAWANAQRDSAVERLYRRLLRNYVVTVERPAPGAGADTASADTGATNPPPAERGD